MKKCRNCNQAMSDNAQFCPNCGTSTADVAFDHSQNTESSNESSINSDNQNKVNDRINVQPTRGKSNKSSNNIIAILAIIFSFLSPIIGLILGIVGINDKGCDEESKKLCKVSIWISSLIIVFGIIVGVISAIVVITQANNITPAPDYGDFGVYLHFLGM